MIAQQMPDAAPLAEAVLAHHERPDGSGYPGGRPAAETQPLARLLAVAGTYAALCCPRPHRPPLDPRAALTTCLELAESGRLDRDFAGYLLELSCYPIGTVVELADGRIAAVVANHPNRLDPRSPGRPVVVVLTDAEGVCLARPEHLDLAATDRGGIVGAVPAERRRTVFAARYPDLAV